DRDNEFNPGPKRKDIPTALRDAFGSSDIQVNVVGYKVVNEEMAKAVEHFKVVEKFALPGHFFNVTDGRDLAAVLERALRQRLRYWSDREDNQPVPGVGERGLDVSVDGANDQWLPGGLAPGGYKVRVYTDRLLTKPIALDGGDLLLIELAPVATL